MKRVIKHWLCATFILLVPAAFSTAAARNFMPPPQPPDLDHLPSTLTSTPISKVVLGNLAVELEHTTLGEIQKSAGIGVVQHHGDAGNSQYWLCYTIRSDAVPQRIWMSSGELSGMGHAVGSFYATAGSKAKKPSGKCPALPVQLRPISLSNKLSIGSTSDQLRHLLGEPSHKKEGWWLYSYSGKVPTSGFDQLAIFGALVGSDGKIVELYQSQATTN